MMNYIESVQYQAGLIVAGCIKGTNRTKLYSELGWESLEDRRIFRRLSLFYKIRNHQTPSYLVEHIHDLAQKRTQRYEKSFFPFCELKWPSLSENLRNAPSIGVFKAIYL